MRGALLVLYTGTCISICPLYMKSNFWFIMVYSCSFRDLIEFNPYKIYWCWLVWPIHVARRTCIWLPLIIWWWNLLLSSYSYVLTLQDIWSRWHLWLQIFTLGQELFRLVCYMYVEKSQGQLCAYMYNSYNLKSNCTSLPLLHKWTSSEIIMKKIKLFYS
jgi:hypothetical protein